MSRVRRHKHVMMESLNNDFELPKENQEIVRVIASRGNNLHEVESATGNENFLVSMPTKFRNNRWVKRGDFILIEPIEEGDKVKGEICRILSAEHIKEFMKNDVWPKKFTKKRAVSDDDEQHNDDALVRNLNRPHLSKEMSDDETSSED